MKYIPFSGTKKRPQSFLLSEEALGFSYVRVIGAKQQTNDSLKPKMIDRAVNKRHPGNRLSVK